VYQWLLLLASQTPTVTMEHSVNATVNTPTLGRINYTNKQHKDLYYEISCSREDVMKPV